MNDPPVPHMQPNQNHNMMSWNSVVSGNQYGVKATVRDDDITTKQQNDASSKEATEVGSKSQKPLPIFGNQQKHAVKKPTAHVKPLKCMAPNDGFTTVHNTNSRQSNNSSSSTHTGSRVSELDDFSTDLLPLPMQSNSVHVTASVIRNIVDYPTAAAVPQTKSNKKKRKKGKEQNAHIAEVSSYLQLSGFWKGFFI